MKRAPELVPLSREHHDALALARRACTTEEPAAVRDEVLRHWSRQIEPHLAAEEQILLPALVAAGAGAEAELARRQHWHLRTWIELLRSGDLAALSAWGSAMREHVQFEERELFALAQELLDLAPLKPALARPANGLHQ